MADNKFNIVLNVRGNVARGMKTASSSVGRAARKMRGALKSVSGAIFSLKGAIGALAVGAIGRDLLGAFAEQEAAVVQFEDALRRGGKFTEEYSAKMQAFASSLQAVGTQGDEAILGVGKLLAMSTKLSKEELPRAIQAATDMSAALGIDLNAAAKLVTNAAAGMTSTFTRYGIKISEAAVESKDFGRILAEIESQVGGADRALRQTTRGSLAAMSNTFGDVKEAAGEFIATILNSGLGEFLQRFLGESEKALKEMGARFRENKALAGSFADAAIFGFKSVIVVASTVVTTVGGIVQVFEEARLAALKFTKTIIDDAAYSGGVLANTLGYLVPVLGATGKMMGAAEKAGLGVTRSLNEQIGAQAAVVNGWRDSETATDAAIRIFAEIEAVMKKNAEQAKETKNEYQSLLDILPGGKDFGKGADDASDAGKKMGRVWDHASHGVDNLRRNMELLHPELQKGVLHALEFQRQMDTVPAVKAINLVTDAVEAMNDAILNVAENTLDTILDAAFEGQIRNAQDLGKIAQDMLKEVAKQLIKIAIIKGVTAVAGAVFKDGGVAEGGITAPSVALTPFASGGVVSGPTPALIGEQPGVKEAIIPMPSGAVQAVVTDPSGGDGGDVSVTFNINAIDGASVERLVASSEFQRGVAGAVIKARRTDVNFKHNS